MINESTWTLLSSELKDTSDWDYIVPIELSPIIRTIVEKHADACPFRAGSTIVDSDYNNGYKFMIKSKSPLRLDIINIIVLIYYEKIM